MNASWRELERRIDEAIKRNQQEIQSCLEADLSICGAVNESNFTIVGLTLAKTFMSEIEKETRAERVAALLENLDYYKWSQGYEKDRHESVLRGFGNMVVRAIKTGDTREMEKWLKDG